MRHSTAASRLLAIATLAALVSATFGVSATAVAREGQAPPRELRFASDPGRETGGKRSFREVDVSRLPAAHGARSPYMPHHARPSGGQFSPAAPGIQSVAPAPTQSTESGAALDPATAFDGLARVTATPTDGEPPDPWVATGPEHVVQAVNTAFRISDRSGAILETVDMFDFFGLGEFYTAGQVAYFDPRVIYDSLHSRWIAIEASFDCFPISDQSTVGTGYLDIAISNSADPTAGWGILSISYPDVIPDYPGLGTSADKVVLSANVFGLVATPGVGMGCTDNDTFAGTEMDVMAWSELTGTGSVNVDYLYSENGAPGSSFANAYFSWRPALQTPATSSTVFAIAESIGESVAYARITGSPAGGGVTTIAISDLTGTGVISPFSLPHPPKQPGSPATIVKAVDGRPTDAIWKDNKLAFVSTYPCDPIGGGVETPRDCVRVSELLTSSVTPSVIQDFLVAESGADLYMGGIGYALNDDLHIAWTRSSETAAATNYPTSYGAYQSATAANNTISARKNLASGTGTYGGVRWGDYVGVAQDPQVPNAVWQANQYSVGAAGWATKVSQLQTGGSSYVPIAPYRVVNSKANPPVGVTGIFSANVPRTFQVRGVGTIPPEAIAVTGNVTVVGQNQAGYVSVTPTATVTPISSTINFPVGDVRANNFTLPLDATGKLAAVYKAATGKTTHVIVDITGYFVAGAGATYVPHPDGFVRIMDTRPIGHIGPLNTFHDGVPQTLSIAEENGIPPEATAITGNLTVVGQTKAGYLSVTPDPPVGVINSSTLNFPVGDVRANGLTADLNGAGDLSITYKTGVGGTANVILDVTGYYVDGASGLSFYPLTPGRLLNTRPTAVLSGLSGVFSANNPRPLAAGGHWGIPASAEALTGNLTVAGQTQAGYVSITPDFNSAPTTSTINFPFGDVRANGVTVPINGSGGIHLVYKAGGGRTTDLILDVSGYFK